MEPVFSFVEYLVGGSVGLLWLVPLVLHLLGRCKLESYIGISEGALALVFAYALGIFLDRTSSFLLNPKGSLEKTQLGLAKLQERYLSICTWLSGVDAGEPPADQAPNESSQKEDDPEGSITHHARKGKKEFSAYLKTTKILAHGSDSLAQAAQAYVGRERIARVMLLNSVVGLIVAVWLQRSFYPLHIMLAAAAVWSLLTWAELQILSEQFKEKAVDVIGVNASKEVE